MLEHGARLLGIALCASGKLSNKEEITLIALAGKVQLRKHDVKEKASGVVWDSHKGIRV